MLAQNLKKPTELGITDAEFDALFKVMGMLERGEIPHEERPVPGLTEHALAPKTFNLASWRCGTAACLGGWAECVGNIHFRRGEFEGTGLGRLFYPDYYEDEIGPSLPAMRAVTTQQAAIALRNYLTHGAPRWEEALAA